jgi:hypothetical protein
MSSGGFAAAGPPLSETAMHWIEYGMMVGIALAVGGTYLIARSNKRLGERIRRRREQRRAEAKAAGANVEALAGRPELPPSNESKPPE